MYQYPSGCLAAIPVARALARHLHCKKKKKEAKFSTPTTTPRAASAHPLPSVPLLLPQTRPVKWMNNRRHVDLVPPPFVPSVSSSTRPTQTRPIQRRRSCSDRRLSSAAAASPLHFKFSTSRRLEPCTPPTPSTTPPAHPPVAPERRPAILRHTRRPSIYNARRPSHLIPPARLCDCETKSRRRRPSADPRPPSPRIPSSTPPRRTDHASPETAAWHSYRHALAHHVLPN